MNILGIIILIIAILCIWRGYVRGLFRSVLIVGATVLAMVLSFYATPYVSKAIQEYTTLDEKVESAVIKQLQLDITQETATKNEQMVFIDTLPCPEALKMAIVNNNNSDVYEGLNVKTFQEYIAHYLSCIFINCLAYVVIQIILSVGLFVLLHVSHALTEIPIIKGIDKTGGIVLGVIQTLAIVWSLFIVISLIGNTPLGIQAYSQINSNPILSYLFQHNWLLDTITDVSNVLFL